MKRILLAICLILLPVISGHALTPAGTVLQNQGRFFWEGEWLDYPTAQMTVAQVAGVAVTLPSDQKVQAGKLWSGYLLISNLGNGPDSFTLTKQASLPWAISLPDFAGVLVQDETRQIPVSVAIPGGAAGQVDVIEVMVRSLFDAACYDGDGINLTAFKPGRKK